ADQHGGHRAQADLRRLRPARDAHGDQRIPVYQSSLTLHKVEHVREMMDVMGDNDICVLRGHGVVVCGSSVEDATIKAIKLDNLATLNLQAAMLGNVASISQDDQHAFLSRKSTGMGGGGAETLWRYYC